MSHLQKNATYFKKPTIRMKSRYSFLIFEPAGQVGRVAVVVQIYTHIYINYYYYLLKIF